MKDEIASSKEGCSQAIANGGFTLSEKQKYLIFAWFVCGLGAIYYSYEYLLRISPSVMEPELRAHFNLSATGFGVLSAIYYYAYVPLQIPVGILLDRYGPRILITIACLICVIGTFIFAATNIYWVALVARFLVGFGSAFAFVGVLKLATIWLPEDKLAMVSGLAAALGTVGGMVGDNLLGTMVIHLGWKQMVQITAYFGIMLSIILWFGIRDSKSGKESHSGTVGSFKRSIADLFIIARNRQIWINGLYGCLVYLPTTVFAEAWGIPYLKHAHHLTQESANFANSLLFLGFTIGAPLMGYVSDKMKRRKPPMFLGATGAALVMFVLIYVPSLNEKSIYVLMLLLGLLYSAQCIVFAVGRELSPNEAAGTAIAMTNMIVMLGAMFMQPLVGRLLDESLKAHTQLSLPIENLSETALQLLYTPGDYQFALSVIPIGIITAALLTFLLKETYANADN